MEEQLENLIRSKSWTELSNDEKKLMIEQLGSQERYEAMRKVFTSIDAMPKSTIVPNPEILRSLKGKFNPRSSWYEQVISYRAPAFAVVLIFALAFAAGWFMHKPEQVTATVPAERLVIKTDTVFVTSQPDTVFVTRVVYRNVTPKTTTTPVFTTVAQPQNESRGVNMKEKEELERLLVSGSE